MKALDGLETSQVEVLARDILHTMKKGRKIFIAGNGGSAATASHMVCDLQKTVLKSKFKKLKKRLNVVCLNDNIPLITAWSNDFGYENIFSQPLINMSQGGDMFIVISGSGNSQNLINAVSQARMLKVRTYGILGFDGGKIKSMLDKYILINSDSYGVVEDLHLVINHMVTEILKIEMNKNV